MSIAQGSIVLAQVVNALLLRETKTRFGQYQLGFFWAIIEPLGWVLVFYLIFSLRGRSAPYGMDIFPFILTGMFPYIIFRNTFKKGMQALNANKGLLYYPQIKPVDFLISRTILEAAIMLPIFVIFMLGYFLYVGEVDIDSFNMIMLGILLSILLGTSGGLLFMSLTVFYPSMRKIISIAIRPLLFLSGIFYTVNELPTELRDALLWNPVLHIVEIVRDGWFKEYQAYYVDYAYVLIWIIVMAYLGLYLERVVQRRLEFT